MKKIIFSAVLMLMASHSFCQDINPLPPLTSDDYLQKAKNQKTAALVLLCGGAVLDIISIATFPKDYVTFDLWGEGNSDETESKANTSAALFIIGSAAMLTSIPLFISSHRNKKKAISLTINTQPLSQLKKGTMYTTKYPALTMKIGL